MASFEQRHPMSYGYKISKAPEAEPSLEDVSAPGALFRAYPSLHFAASAIISAHNASYFTL